MSMDISLLRAANGHEASFVPRTAKTFGRPFPLACGHTIAEKRTTLRLAVDSGACPHAPRLHIRDSRPTAVSRALVQLRGGTSPVRNQLRPCADRERQRRHVTSADRGLTWPGEIHH